ncbi:transmembrane protein c2orf18-like [Stylonychia lemnae]|uniref:Transmembrane protein c2orf18-like n=1 Tax=Stylonychia lemnae TaxID=5949 RepID=A0A078ACL5_STYLE|nr:transmembrane protein c2orf18-like [Stylonychia lemnae]|eukprot:CDW79995.1 transmembrane protein c2orf18-like [Stylonychia lemnae]
MNQLTQEELAQTNGRLDNQSKLYVQPKLSRLQFYLLMAFYLIAGGMVTITLKVQNIQISQVDGKPFQWQHPFVQVLFMFIGEMTSGLIYISLFRKSFKAQRLSRMSSFDNTQKEVANPFVYAIPASTDTIASFMVFFGLTQIQASVYQMMKGFIVVVTAILSVVFLKRQQYYHHFIGIFLVVLGVGTVGFSAYFRSNEAESSNLIMGMLFVLGGQTFQAFHLVIQDHYLKKYDIHQFQLIGWEGIWGIVILSVLLPIFQQIPCDQPYCVNGKIEDSVLAFNEILSNWYLALFIFLYFLAIAFYNGLGITITKYASCVHQTVTDQSRVLLVWTFFILYPGIAQEEFRTLQFLGFCIIVTGNFIYNEIIRLNKESKMFKDDDELLENDSNEFQQTSKQSLIPKNQLQ